YHRFHAPCDARVRSVLWIAGDTWNVNRGALKRVERLFCKNERVVIDFERRGFCVTLVAVAAILVSSVQLEVLPTPPRPHARRRRRKGQLARYACDIPVQKGEELGHFQNGSTIILFAKGRLKPSPALSEGSTMRVGQPLFRVFSRSRQSSRPAL